MQISKNDKPLDPTQKKFAETLFCENYDVLAKRIFDLLRNIDPSAADDCLGNLFLTLCLCIDKVIEHENPKAWLLKTAKYICLKHIRSVACDSKRQVPLNDDISYPFDTEEHIIDDILFCQWKKEGLKEKLIGMLNENERTILRMSVECKMSNGEIAKKLNKSEDAIRFTLYYIRKKISDMLYSRNF